MTQLSDLERRAKGLADARANLASIVQSLNQPLRERKGMRKQR